MLCRAFRRRQGVTNLRKSCQTVEKRTLGTGLFVPMFRFYSKEGFFTGEGAVIDEYPHIKKATADDCYWACIEDNQNPIMLDTREKREYNLYSLMGTFNFPSAEAKAEDFSDIPLDRPVFLFSGSDDAVPAFKVAEKVYEVGHRDVSIVKGGIEKLRERGFFYSQDYVAHQTLLKQIEQEKKEEEEKNKK
eukprot:TRINITY_DN3640_c0_g1_i1.p1 TRINITY_DN3640_c0_g1~~TRINITY_DN3640_c0_g1_i1.p1  ORF type:complete len:190 (+),score=55.51 TRINITY_DN3640_c0_g1_i1:49-618(+)